MNIILLFMKMKVNYVNEIDILFMERVNLGLARWIIR